MKIRVLIVAVAAIAIVGFVTGPFTSPLAAQDSGPKNLFAQYYTPSGASQSHAGMYPAPHPVPRNVGHTYYTYQPLMPHEMLYTHSRNYFNYHAGPDAFYCNGCNGSGGGSGYTKTTVKWQSGNMHIGPLPFSRVPFQQLQYNWSKFRHNAGSGQGGLFGGAPQSGGLGGGLGSRGGGGCLSGNCLGSLRSGAGAGGAGFGDGGLGDGFDGGGEFGNGSGDGSGSGFGDSFGGGGSLSPGCGCDGGQFAGAGPGAARMSSVAADNSWAQKAAAATASLVNGRVQR